MYFYLSNKDIYYYYYYYYYYYVCFNLVHKLMSRLIPYNHVD